MLPGGVQAGAYLPMGEGLQEVGLPGPVLPDETVSPAHCQLDGAVLQSHHM